MARTSYPGAPLYSSAMAIAAIPPLAQALPEMRDGLTLLVVGTMFASFLIPAAVLLFLFVPYSMLKSPLFIFNVCAIVLGLVQQGLYIYFIIKTVIHKAVPTGPVVLTIAIEILLSVCLQAIFLMRLVAVYYPSRLPFKTTVAVYSPIVAFKIARLVNAGALQNLLSRLPANSSVIIAAQAVWASKYLKIEWFLQLFDDMIVSGLFIYKIHTHMKDTSPIRNDSNHSRSDSYSQWHQRFRTLFYIWTSNCIFPIIFNIAEIAVVFYDTNFLHGLIVVTVNCYMTILGVLLATIWAKGSEWGQLPCLGSQEATVVVSPMVSIELAQPLLQIQLSETEFVVSEEITTPTKAYEGFRLGYSGYNTIMKQESMYGKVSGCRHTGVMVDEKARVSRRCGQMQRNGDEIGVTNCTTLH